MSTEGSVLRIGVAQEAAEGRPGGCFHLEHARPAGGVAGGLEFGEPIAVAGAAGEDEFAVGGELEEAAVGEVRAGAVDLEE